MLDRALNIVYCWLILLLLTLFRVRNRPKWLHKSLIFLRGGSGVAKAAFFVCLQGLIPLSSLTLSWSHVRSVSHCRPHESPQFSKCKGSRPVRVTWAAQRAGRGDPLGSDVDVTLTVETVVHLGQALTLRENPYCCFVVIVNSTNTVFP